MSAPWLSLWVTTLILIVFHPKLASQQDKSYSILKNTNFWKGIRVMRQTKLNWKMPPTRQGILLIGDRTDDILGLGNYLRKTSINGKFHVEDPQVEIKKELSRHRRTVRLSKLVLHPFDLDNFKPNNKLVPLMLCPALNSTSNFDADLSSAFVFNTVMHSMGGVKAVGVLSWNHSNPDTFRERLQNLIFRITNLTTDANLFIKSSLITITVSNMTEKVDNTSVEKEFHALMSDNPIMMDIAKELLTNYELVRLPVANLSQNDINASSLITRLETLPLYKIEKTRLRYSVSPMSTYYMHALLVNETADMQILLNSTFAASLTDIRRTVLEQAFGSGFAHVKEKFAKYFSILILVNETITNSTDPLLVYGVLERTKFATFCRNVDGLMQQLMVKSERITFYKDNLDHKLHFDRPIWKESFDKVLKIAEKQSNWYSFLNQQHATYQKESLNGNFSITKPSNDLTGRRVHRGKMLQQIESAYNHNSNHLQNNALNSRFTIRQLKEVGQIVANTAKDITPNCKNDTLTLTGNTIVIESSAIMAYLNDCRDAKHVIVLAAETVVLRDFSLNSFNYSYGPISVSIIAPTLVVPHDAKEGINLTRTGVDQVDCVPNFDQYVSRCAGGAGQSGNVFILVNNITGNLRIATSGGNGGTPLPNSNADCYASRNFGGVGGYPGIVKVVQLSSEKSVEIYQNLGANGKPKYTCFNRDSKTVVNWRPEHPLEYLHNGAEWSPDHLGISEPIQRSLTVNNTIADFIEFYTEGISSINVDVRLGILGNLLNNTEATESFNTNLYITVLKRLLTIETTFLQEGSAQRVDRIVFAYRQLLLAIEKYSIHMTFNRSCDMSCSSPGCEGINENDRSPVTREQCIYSGYAYDTDTYRCVLPLRFCQFDTDWHQNYWYWCKKPGDYDEYSTQRVIPLYDLHLCHASGGIWGFEGQPLEENVHSLKVKCINSSSNPIVYQCHNVTQPFFTLCRKHTNFPYGGNRFADLISYYHNNNYSIVGQCFEKFKLISPKRCRTVCHNETEGDVKNRKALATMINLILSKLGSLDSLKNDLMVDVTSYLDYAIEVVNELKALEENKKILDEKLRIREQNLAMQAKQEKAVAEYQASIDSKIAEGKKNIQEHLQPAIHAVNEKLGEAITKLVDLIQKKIKEAEESIENLEKEKEKLKDALPMKILFGALNVVSGVLAMTGPIGSAVGAGLSLATGIAKSALTETSAAPLALDLSNSVGKAAGELNDWLVDHKETESNEYDDQITKYKDIYKELPEDENKDSKGRFEELDGDYEKLRKAKVPDHNAMSAKRKEIRKEIHALEKDKDKKSAKTQGLISKAKVVSSACSVIESGLSLYKELKSDDEQIDQINQAIEKKREEIDGYKKLEHGVYSVITPMVNNLKDSTEKWASGDATGKSLTKLIVIKHDIRANIANTRFTMQKFATALQTDVDIVHLTEKLDGSMSAAFDVYDQIEKYCEEKKRVELMAVLAHPNFIDTTLDDSPLSLEVRNMERAIVGNNVIGIFNRALTHVANFAFPFAAILLREFRLPAHLQFKNDTHYVINTTAKNILKLKQTLLVDKAMIGVVDQARQILKFENIGNDWEAFFEWHGDKFQSEVNQLLSGKEIILTASILDGTSTYDAVRFNTIELELRAQDDLVNVELKKALKGFKINMVHSGDNYYRFQNNYYVIKTTSLDLMYSFDRYENGSHRLINAAYLKLKNGDIVLSPYTTWKIKLSPTLVQNDFLRLQKFFDQPIDMFLNGDGTALELRMPNQLKSTDMESYYKCDETLPKLACIREHREDCDKITCGKTQDIGYLD